MNKNKALVVITSVVILVAAALAIFYFFFARNSTPGQSGPGINIPIDNGTGSSGSENGPEGSGTGPETGGTANTGSTTTNGNNAGNGFINQPQTFSQLRELSSIPVSGATINDKGSLAVIRYVERAQGHIYETTADSKTDPVRISNTTIIPRIYEADFVKSGQAVILRYLNDQNQIQTFYTSFKAGQASTSDLTLENGVFLPANITALSVSPDGSQIFYIQKSAIGSIGVVANPDGSRKSQIFKSMLSEWTPLWQSPSNIAIYTNPSAMALGYAYFLKASTGAQSRILGDSSGLTILPNYDSSLVLYSDQSQNRLGLEVFSTKNQTTAAFAVKTLPEKCVWSRINGNVIYCAVPQSVPVGDYPDAWYRGEVAFNDQIEKINLKTGETEIILDPEALTKKAMDITNLQLNSKDGYLMFVNKNDLSLWLLDLSPAPITNQT